MIKIPPNTYNTRGIIVQKSEYGKYIYGSFINKYITECELVSQQPTMYLHFAVLQMKILVSENNK